MSRRQRHLNLASCGATLALDVRTISGLADGDPVATWSGKPGSTVNVTAAGSARPTYKTAILNGQPTVRFDGAANVMTGAVFTAGVVASVMVVMKMQTNGAFSICWTNGNSGTSGYGLYEAAGQIYYIYGGAGAITDGALPTTPKIFTTVHRTAPNAALLWINGVSTALTGANPGTTTPSGSTSIGGEAGPNGPAKMDIYAIVGLGSEVSAALRKRIEQSLSMSFRIPCG